MDKPLFEFAPYHLLMAGCGLVIIVAYWLPRWISGKEPAASGLLIIGGLAVFGIVPGIPQVFSPVNRPGFWEIASEFAVIIALFGTGIRIDRIAGRGLWTPTVRLLAVAMPLCMVAVAVMGTLAGFALGSAILLAAVLAPTDPVLAADVQVGAPLEGREHPVRFALTAEAGLNDGLAFPFVYLAIFVTSMGLDLQGWGLEWAGFYLLYKIAVGVLAGYLAGKLLGMALFSFPRHNPLAETGSGVIAMAGVLFTYGLTELAEGYGFIAAFVMGAILRRQEEEHEFHGRLHSFSEALEHAVTAILLVLLGGAIPDLLPYLGWREAIIGLALVFAIRPAFGMLALLGTDMTVKQRGVVAFYGVRGMGSIYYLAYAAGAIDLQDAGPLWAVVTFTIVLSTLVHGFSAGSVVNAATSDEAKMAEARKPGAKEA